MGSATGSGIASGAGQGAATGAAVGGPWGAAIGAVIGGTVGGIGGAGIDRANTARKNTIAEYMNQLQALDMPRYADLKLALERYAAGEPLTPDQLTALQDVDSEIQKITQDKVAKQTQLDALAAMKARSRGGLTLQDKADLLEAQKTIDRQSSGVQKSIVQNMQARGVAGSGSELAARMMANQQATEASSQNALNVAANAQNRALAALKESAVLGRQIGQDQLDFDQMKAKSADETRRSNLERLQDAMRYNIGNQNQAKQQNFNRANTVADKNVDIGNREQEHNKELLMADYNNQVNRLKGIYEGKYGKIAEKDESLKNAQNSAASYMELMNSVGGMAGSFGGMGGGSKKPTSMGGGSYFDPSGLA